MPLFLGCVPVRALCRAKVVVVSDMSNGHVVPVLLLPTGVALVLAM